MIDPIDAAATESDPTDLAPGRVADLSRRGAALTREVRTVVGAPPRDATDAASSVRATDLPDHVLEPQPRRRRVDTEDRRRSAHRVRAGAARAVVGDDLFFAWRAYWASGCDQSRNELVEAYQFLVREIVGRFASRLPRSVDRGDLATAANVGLIACITGFDPARGVRFEAYADRRIRGALLDELRSQDWLPRPWRQRIEQHKREGERLRARLGREPSDDELADALDLSTDQYQLLFGVGLPGISLGSKGALDLDDGHAGIDVVPDTRSEAPDNHLTRDELMSLVAQRLTDQEYRIVYLKYWEDLPMRAIGELTSLSESRICKIHTRLIGRLRDRLTSHS